MKKIDLSEFLKSTQIDGVIVLDKEGTVIEESGMPKKNSVGAMLAVINQMIVEFTEEIDMGFTKKIIIKCDERVFVVVRIEGFIIGVYSKDISKSGIITASIDKLIKVN